MQFTLKELLEDFVTYDFILYDADARPISDDLPALVRTLAAVTTMTLTHDSTFVGRGEDPARAVDIVERLWLNALWGGR